MTVLKRLSRFLVPMTKYGEISNNDINRTSGSNSEILRKYRRDERKKAYDRDLVCRLCPILLIGIPACFFNQGKSASAMQRRSGPCVLRLCHPVVALKLMYEVAIMHRRWYLSSLCWLRQGFYSLFKTSRCIAV